MPAEQSALGHQDQTQLNAMQEADAAKKCSHDMWLRVKEHQERLKSVLVLEAKKDLYERLVAEQAELDQEN